MHILDFIETKRGGYIPGTHQLCFFFQSLNSIQILVVLGVNPNAEKQQSGNLILFRVLI